MITVVFVENAAQPEVAAILYVTVYVPPVLAARLIAPVVELMVRPAGLALYVPPAVPVRVTLAVPVALQYGDPAYVIEADGALTISIAAVAVKDAQPPEAGTVYETV